MRNTWHACHTLVVSSFGATGSVRAGAMLLIDSRMRRAVSLASVAPPETAMRAWAAKSSHEPLLATSGTTRRFGGCAWPNVKPCDGSDAAAPVWVARPATAGPIGACACGLQLTTPQLMHRRTTWRRDRREKPVRRSARAQRGPSTDCRRTVSADGAGSCVTSSAGLTRNTEAA